ncbi:uncharacterized protein [Chironomus tepperi]|uniref:uncharacterized protein n=1 Tax=Chironomus tepperi TaxID=113505 RepID=UPI00391F0CC1
MEYRNLNFFFLISIVLLICSIRVIKSQNVELYCWKYAADVKCQVSNHVSINMTVDVKRITSKTLKQKQLEDAPVLVLSRDHQIESLPQNIGSHFKHLQEFILNLVGLKIVRQSDFNHMTLLKTLNLADNKLTEIPYNTFDDLVNLVILFINGNQLKHIDSNLLKNVKSLKAFNAQHNQLEVLEDIFTENHQLESISLNNNKLKTINAKFTSLNKIKHIDLRNNPEICTRCTVRNQKSLNKTYDICIADDNNEKRKHENQFKNCVMETLKTNATFEDKLSDCAKDTSFVKCVVGRLNNISGGEQFLNKCLTSKKNAEETIKNNLDICLYCTNNITDITKHAKLCELRYSEFSLYNITTFQSEVEKFFN